MAAKNKKGNFPAVVFSEHDEKQIIVISAYDLFAQAHEEGLITDEELAYLKKKYVDKP